METNVKGLEIQLYFLIKLIYSSHVLTVRILGTSQRPLHPTAQP